MNNTTVLELAQITLYAGFYKGKWNPDLMMLLMEPVIYMIMALAERAGVEYRLDDEESVSDKDRVGAFSRLDVKADDAPPEAIEPLLEKIDELEAPSLLGRMEEDGRT